MHRSCCVLITLPWRTCISGGKRKRTEDGNSGTDCEEESDEYDEGAEHEYESEDSSEWVLHSTGLQQFISVGPGIFLEFSSHAVYVQ